ncbi:MAG: CopG family transcriptional regulator [Myxococcales bacterium]
MARTTSDPKPYTVAIRLNEEDMRLLDRLARQSRLSRSELVRLLLHASSSTEKAKRKG